MKRVLINWYYDRFDLTEYLLQFARDMEIIFISRQLKRDEPSWLKLPNISVAYWGDYRTPYELLDALKPSMVVFADIEAFNQVALNIAARNRGITTFVLQHGLRGSYEIDEALSVEETNASQIQFSGTSFWSFRFLFSALKVRNLSQVPRLLKFIYARKKMPLTSALYNNQFELRRADYYIEFSEDNTGYHSKRDGIRDDRFILTGNPMLDGYFEFLNRHSTDKTEYCLLVDCPFVEANFYQDHGITPQRKNEYLRKLDRWSAANGFRLKVKLHPISFKTEGLYQSENVTYLRDADLKELIAPASYVFFVHFSSVAPVILAYKPCVYFHSTLQEHGNQFKKLGVPTLPLFEFPDTEKNLPLTARKLSMDLIAPLLHSTDGKASERIKKALLEHS